jgi:hypothetical protein
VDQISGFVGLAATIELLKRSVTVKLVMVGRLLGIGRFEPLNESLDDERRVGWCVGGGNVGAGG